MSQSEAPNSHASDPSNILLDEGTPDIALAGVAEPLPSEISGAEPLAPSAAPPVDVDMPLDGREDASLAGRALADAAADTPPPEAGPEAGPEKDPATSTPSMERLVALLRMRSREWVQGREWPQWMEFPPSPRAIRLLLATFSGLLLLALLPALLNTSHRSAGAASAPPTATPLATATSLASPTAMAGYVPLVDSADGFVIQYPLAWTCATSNPGIDCIDSPSAQNYRLQVQLPGGWTGADTGRDPGDAAIWVDYALSAFSDVPGRTYQRLSDANQSAIIGGVVWQGGAAVIGIEPDDGSSQATATPTAPLALIRVQVYATLYNNRPYIIALYAADDQFSAGSTRYFQPMLGSFAFLSANHDS